MEGGERRGRRTAAGPVTSAEPLETLALVPYAAAKLRITVSPVTGDPGNGARSVGSRLDFGSRRSVSHSCC
jgi:hypothetical protein